MIASGCILGAETEVIANMAQERVSPYTDRDMLRNALRFTIPQRAFIVDRLLSLEPLETQPPGVRAALALDAFEQYMVSGEDVLIWLFALIDWTPRSEAPSDTLLAKLDRTQIGMGRWREENLLTRLEAMDTDAFRAALHIPDDNEIARRKPPVAFETTLEEAVASWRTGTIRIITRRQGDDRAWVRAYNKAKHGLLGVFEPVADDYAVVLVTARGGYESEPVALDRVHVQCRPRDIRKRVLWTQQMLAVLQGIVAFELGVHFDEWYPTPPWATMAWAAADDEIAASNAHPFQLDELP